MQNKKKYIAKSKNKLDQWLNRERQEKLRLLANSLDTLKYALLNILTVTQIKMVALNIYYLDSKLHR